MNGLTEQSPKLNSTEEGEIGTYNGERDEGEEVSGSKFSLSTLIAILVKAKDIGDMFMCLTLCLIWLVHETQ